ncbi:MAG: hypothetical protein RIR33_595 [Pseudomonadota bacterium]|jgi:protein TonB
MYGAMREHAPSSTRITGLLSAAALTVATGYALATGIGVNIRSILPDPITYLALADELKTEPPPSNAERLDTSETKLVAPPISVDIPQFESDERVSGDPDPGPLPPPHGQTGAGASPTPAQSTIRVGAKLLPAPPPPYPEIAIRLRHEGISGLSVCVDRFGRVSSASLVSSSGNAKLDQEALKWIRSARFSPSTLDGIAQPVCGHSVLYEWRLQDAR